MHVQFEVSHQAIWPLAESLHLAPTATRHTSNLDTNPLSVSCPVSPLRLDTGGNIRQSAVAAPGQLASNRLWCALISLWQAISLTSQQPTCRVHGTAISGGAAGCHPQYESLASAPPLLQSIRDQHLLGPHHVQPAVRAIQVIACCTAKSVLQCGDSCWRVRAGLPMERQYSLPVSPPRLPRTLTSMVPLAEYPGSSGSFGSHLSAPQPSLLPAYGHSPAVRDSGEISMLCVASLARDVLPATG